MNLTSRVPRLSSELYTAFRAGYLAKYSQDSGWLGEEFLRLIEAEQDKRDNAAKPDNRLD